MRLRRSGLACREVDGDMVVLDLQSSTYLTTNRSGAMLVELLAQERTLPELVDALTERYGVSRAAATVDVEAFVRALAAKGLLEPVEEPSPHLPRGGSDATGPG